MPSSTVPPYASARAAISAHRFVESGPGTCSWPRQAPRASTVQVDGRRRRVGARTPDHVPSAAAICVRGRPPAPPGDCGRQVGVVSGGHLGRSSAQRPRPSMVGHVSTSRMGVVGRQRVAWSGEMRRPAAAMRGLVGKRGRGVGGA